MIPLICAGGAPRTAAGHSPTTRPKRRRWWSWRGPWTSACPATWCGRWRTPPGAPSTRCAASWGALPRRRYGAGRVACRAFHTYFPSPPQAQAQRGSGAPRFPPPPPAALSNGLVFLRVLGGARDALEGEGPQRQSQKQLGRRLEEVAKADGGGYCRLQLPLKLTFGVRETVAGHRLGALEGGTFPPSNASLGGALGRTLTLPAPRVYGWGWWARLPRHRVQARRLWGRGGGGRRLRALLLRPPPPLCVGIGGKDMGTGSVYRGRWDALHSGRLSETHGPTRPVENVWTLTHTTTQNTTHHNKHPGARRCGGDERVALMLAATEP